MHRRIWVSTCSPGHSRSCRYGVGRQAATPREAANRSSPLRFGCCQGVASHTERPGALLDGRRRRSARIGPSDPLGRLESPEAFFESVGAQFTRAAHPQKKCRLRLIKRFRFAAVSENFEVPQGLVREGRGFVTLDNDANGGSHLGR